MPPGEDIMVYLNGSKRSFRCDNDETGLGRPTCGCNVFHKHPTKANRLVCNACGAVYETEVPHAAR